MASKDADVYVLIPRIYDYAILHGKRDSGDMIKATDLEMGSFFWIIQVGLIWIHEYLKAENLPQP